MYFKLHTVNNPTRLWARKLPYYIHDHFREAFESHLYVDRDHLDSQIITLPFIPIDYKDVALAYRHTIAMVTKYTETIAIWEKIIPMGYVDTINTFTVTGYEQDVLAALRIIGYVVNGLNNLRVDMIKDYRRVKINKRRRDQAKGIKNKPYQHANHKAIKMQHQYIEALNKELGFVEDEYSVLHESKIENIENFITKHKKLNYKAYHIKGKPPISHAYCRDKEKVLNRIIR